MNRSARTPRAVLLILFFVSGATALLYQIAWLKYLGLVFGNTVQAAATLIAIFLAGLGIGAFVFGRSFRSIHPLLLYAVLEALIGLIGSLSPNAFALLDHAYVASFRLLAQAPTSLAVARALAAAVFLLPPTILMGGTLPVLVRWWTGIDAGSGRAVSSLYAVNTFGAVAGTAAAGFFLIPRFGLLATLFLAVLLNFLLAVAATGMGVLARAGKLGPPAESSPLRIVGLPGAILLGVSLMMGLTSIADEVFWSRILVLHLGSSVYAYSLMLFSFLTGIGLGSAIVDRFITRLRIPLTLALIEIGLGIALAAQVHAFGRFSDLLEWLAVLIQPQGHVGLMVVLTLAVMMLILLPTTLMGATFPLMVRLYEDNTSRGETDAVGVVYLFNTIGSISGSLLAGFVLIPLIGSQRGLFLMALINLLIGFWFLRGVLREPAETRSPMTRPVAVAISMIALVLFVPAFVRARPDSVLLSAGAVSGDQSELLLFREDVTATVALKKFPTGALSLELNGVNVAGTTASLLGTQKLQGHIPLLIHPRPQSVLHIGFGSGGTAWSVSRHPVREIRIAEISPEVLEVSDQYLRMVNHGVLEDPRVRIEINDGRNYVLAARDRFDVILSDSIHPRYAGNGSLYTLDYFELCRERLGPGGVVSMWLPMYSLTPRNYLMILRSFVEVFPNTTVWYVPNHLNAFTIVIGRTEQGPIPFDRLQGRIEGRVENDLEEIGLAVPEMLLSTLMLDAMAVRQITRGIPPHVDDIPAVEYESGRIIDRDGAWLQNFGLLSRHMSPLARAFDGADERVLAAAENEREVRVRAHLRELAEQVTRRHSPAPEDS